MSATAGLATQPVIGPQEFGWIKEFLYRQTGINLKPGKEYMVMGRLERRLRHYGLVSYGDYFARLSDPAEVRIAVDLLTTNETYFFREPDHFRRLGTLLAGAPAGRRPIRVWSAACSSGEEAWTIAMTLAECLSAGQEWEVIGTDISSRMVADAQRGIYPMDAAERIPEPLLRRYCLRGRGEHDGWFAIGPALRRRVRFGLANLNDLPAELGQFDVIFLRNVMIYFGPETKQDLLQRLQPLLRPGGHLITSHCETLNGLRCELQQVVPSIYRAPAPNPRPRDRGADSA